MSETDRAHVAGRPVVADTGGAPVLPPDARGPADTREPTDGREPTNAPEPTDGREPTNAPEPTGAHEPRDAREPTKARERGNAAAGADAPAAATLVYLTPIGDFIHSADAKAGTILAVLGIMFTLLARFGPWLDQMLRGPSGMMVMTIVLLAGFAGAALGAVVQSFRTISPRFPPAPTSLAFFGDIARLRPEEYVTRATSLGAAEALAERLKYNHTGSRIILLKFRQLRRALRCFELAAVCWLLLATILSLKAFLA